MGSLRSWSIFGLFFFLVVSCVDDDQTNIKPEHRLLANPVPISSTGDVKQFAENNAKHKILLGVFDTGIDYNHPHLRDHVHFQLDEKGVPAGAGMDFLAKDSWAANRVIRTSAYEFEFLTDAQKKQALDKYKTIENYNNDVRRSKMGRVCAVDKILKIDPRLGKYVSAFRDLGTEAGDLKHGTHVAGLMSYDNPEIGIIPYRVLPYHESEQDKIDFVAGKADVFVDNFEAAIQHARQQGVKIVNLSLGGSFTKPRKSDGAGYEEKLEKYTNYKRMLTDRLSVIVQKSPDILFVAAAGNDSGWSDNRVRLQYPCGIEADNILCVGALNEDNTQADFTNVPMNRIDLVFAQGVEIISTVPSDNCDQFRKLYETMLIPGAKDEGLCKYDLKKKAWVEDSEFLASRTAYIKAAYDSCQREKSLFQPLSGTSMATPLVSRLAAEAWIEKPSLSAREVIAALKAKAQVDNTWQVPAYILKTKTPSWYALFDEKPASDNRVVAGPGFSNLLLPAIAFAQNYAAGEPRTRAAVDGAVKKAREWFTFAVHPDAGNR